MTAAQREQLVARGIVVRDEPVTGLVIKDDRLRGVALASGAVVEVTMTTTESRERRVPPPSTHQLALMIWLAVFPTLTAINLLLGGWLATLEPVLRTLLLSTLAVPIVSYGIMPRLQRARSRLILRRAHARN